MTETQARIRSLSGDVELLDPSKDAVPVEQHSTPRRPATVPPWARAGLGIAAVVVAGLGVTALRDTSTATHPVTTTADASAQPSPPTPVLTTPTADPTAPLPLPPSEQQTLALPVAAIGGNLPGALRDPDPTADPGIDVLHPLTTVTVHTQPGGPAFARLSDTLATAPTWVPIIDRQPGWALVLLPGIAFDDGTNPAGWIHLDANVGIGQIAKRLRVDRGTGTVVVFEELGRATVPATATASPEGRRSFVALSPATRPTWWIATKLWPLITETGRVCTTTTGGLVIPVLPTQSPLGHLDATHCLTTPSALRTSLRELPAGSVVLVR